MRTLGLSALVALLATAFVAATASGKADKTGWPKVDVHSPQFFKTYSTNGVTHNGSSLSDELLGYHGSDHLSGGGSSDVIWGDWKPNNPSTGNNDHIDGGPGSDFLYVSHGRKQTIIGGPGNDKIHARYGGGTVSCGPGKDTVWQSHKRRANWKIAKDCEKITYALDKKQT